MTYLLETGRQLCDDLNARVQANLWTWLDAINGIIYFPYRNLVSYVSFPNFFLTLSFPFLTLTIHMFEHAIQDRRSILALLMLSTTEQVFGHEKWLERDGMLVFLHPRRFGRENLPVLERPRSACPGQVCSILAGQAVTPLLAGQPEHSQQDFADAIVDASRQFDQETQRLTISIAREYRQAEKNTPPDFTTNSLRNLVLCQRALRNPELDGLVQAQDPNNDPNPFDPVTRSTRKGTQPNISAFRGRAVRRDTPNFVSCPTPEIEIGVGFDGRRETSYQSVDKDEFFVIDSKGCLPSHIATNSDDHGSAKNVNIIIKAVWDTLVNRCNANQDALVVCAQAQAAAAAAIVNTGDQADAFNAVCGIQIDFVNTAY